MAHIEDKGNGLDKNQIKEIEARLKMRHKELKGELDRLRKELSEGVPQNFKDALPYKEEEEVTEDIDRMEEEEILQIEEALQRISDGTFGVCRECGKKINIERLKALPYSLECIECKEKKERS